LCTEAASLKLKGVDSAVLNILVDTPSVPPTRKFVTVILDMQRLSITYDPKIYLLRVVRSVFCNT
jgi:hypothetical protein